MWQNPIWNTRYRYQIHCRYQIRSPLSLKYGISMTSIENLRSLQNGVTISYTWKHQWTWHVWFARTQTDKCISSDSQSCKKDNWNKRINAFLTWLRNLHRMMYCKRTFHCVSWKQMENKKLGVMKNARMPPKRKCPVSDMISKNRSGRL